MKIYTYFQNDRQYILVDGRHFNCARYRRKDVIRMLCLIYDTDGLLILSNSDAADFRVESFASDGLPSEEGLESAVAFADLVGVKAFHSTDWDFESGGSIRHARILAHDGEQKLILIGDKGKEVDRNTFCSTSFQIFAAGTLTACQGELTD